MSAVKLLYRCLRCIRANHLAMLGLDRFVLLGKDVDEVHRRCHVGDRAAFKR